MMQDAHRLREHRAPPRPHRPRRRRGRRRRRRVAAPARHRGPAPAPLRPDAGEVSPQIDSDTAPGRPDLPASITGRIFAHARAHALGCLGCGAILPAGLLAGLPADFCGRSLDNGAGSGCESARAHTMRTRSRASTVLSSSHRLLSPPLSPIPPLHLPLPQGLRP